ncbi:IS701 family transposase [Streptomyces sp. NPDC059008]|uniref:IS701 family transposase n=1 Tax=Streptomyces sp. NPDC059008 TaxID=3346693 RepID=UPI0036AF2CED
MIFHDLIAGLVVDDTQMIKKGTKSAGVAPQHCGATNHTENCQVAVMLSYTTERGHAFIRHRLYLPERRTSDRERCREADIPDEVAFATKPAQAVELIGEAVDTRVPFGWAAVDGGYGQYATVRHYLREQRLRYVAAVPSSFPLAALPGHQDAGRSTVKRADGLLTRITGQRWERRSCGEGSKGQRFYDWALFEVNVKDDHPADGFAHSLLIRRSVSDPGKAGYFLVHAPAGTTMSVMVACAGLRWKIEEDNRHGTRLTGLDDYQVRTWTAWHHQITACMFAHAFLVLAA